MKKSQNLKEGYITLEKEAQNKPTHRRVQYFSEK